MILPSSLKASSSPPRRRRPRWRWASPPPWPTTPSSSARRAALALGAGAPSGGSVDRRGGAAVAAAVAPPPPRSTASPLGAEQGGGAATARELALRAPAPRRARGRRGGGRVDTPFFWAGEIFPAGLRDRLEIVWTATRRTEPCHENSAELTAENEADGEGEGVVETYDTMPRRAESLDLMPTVEPTGDALWDAVSLPLGLLLRSWSRASDGLQQRK